MDALDTYLKTCTIERPLLLLVQLRASQINGCAYLSFATILNVSFRHASPHKTLKNPKELSVGVKSEPVELGIKLITNAVGQTERRRRRVTPCPGKN